MLTFMNTTSMYVINAILVLLVVRQIRERRLDLRGLAVPVLAVGAAALFFLHSVPGRGNDIPLELICASAGAVMGALAGLATHLRRDGDGLVLGRAAGTDVDLRHRRVRRALRLLRAAGRARRRPRGSYARQ